MINTSLSTMKYLGSGCFNFTQPMVLLFSAFLFRTDDRSRDSVGPTRFSFSFFSSWKFLYILKSIMGLVLEL